MLAQLHVIDAGSYWEDPSTAYNYNCNGRNGNACRVKPAGTTLRPGRCNAGERIIKRAIFDDYGIFDSETLNYAYQSGSDECCNYNDYEQPCSLSNRHQNCEFDSNNDNEGDSVACISCTTLFKPDSFSYHAMGSNGPISGSSYGADWWPTLNGVKTAYCGHGTENEAWCPTTLELPAQLWIGYEQNYIPDVNNGCLCANNEFAFTVGISFIEYYQVTTTEWIYPKPYSDTTVLIWDYTHLAGYSSDPSTGDPSYWGSYAANYDYYQNQQSSYNVISKKNKCLKCPKINGIQTVSSKGAGLSPADNRILPVAGMYPGDSNRGAYNHLSCQCPAGYESDSYQCVLCPVGKYSRLEYIPYPHHTYNSVAVAADIAEDYNLYGNAPYYSAFSPDWGENGYLNSDFTCSYGACQTGIMSNGYKYPGTGASGTLNRRLANSQCVSCATGFVTPSTGSTSRSQCIECAAGYWKDTAPNPDVCVTCAVGKYSTTTAAYSESVCTWCPANSWTDSSASDSLADCRCNAGYFGSSGNCQACPSNSHSLVGSTSCYCNSGYYSTTSALTTTDTCVACPSNSQTVGGTDGQTFCVCNTGYYGTEAKAENDCTACPPNSQQPAIDQLTCLCNTGYTGIGTASQTCSFCEAGTYKSVIGSAACVSCGLVQSNTLRDGCLPCSSINAYGDNSAVGMQVSMQKEFVRTGYPRMSQSQCVHGDGKDFDIAHRLEYPDFCMTSSGSTSYGFEFLTHYKTKQMLIMSDSSNNYRLYAANLSHTDPRIFRFAGGTNVDSDADGVVSAAFVDGPLNTGKLYKVGAIHASDVHHVVFMHDYTTIRAVDLRDNAWGEIFHICGPNSATGGYLPSTGSCSLTGTSAPRFARQYSGSYTNYLGESFDGKYLYSANYYGITRLELTSTNGNRPTGIEARYFMGLCRTTGSDCQGQQSINTYHIGSWSSCTSATFESGRANFVCTQTNGQLTCENTPSPENFYTHLVAMTIAGTKMYVMSSTCAFVINVDHTSTQYAQFTRVLSSSNPTDFFGYSSLRIRSPMTSSADNSTIWIFQHDLAKIIEWNTIANTFTPTVVWSTSYSKTYDAKQSYVLEPRQYNTGPGVYGLQFANEKLYYTFYQYNRYYAETQMFEIPVTGSCWNCPENSGISETALWTARCIEFGMTLSLTARATNDWVCCASGDTTCTFSDILDALMMSSSSSYVKSSNRCSRPAPTVTPADTGNALSVYANALRGTPCILEEAYRDIDVTMCTCSESYEKDANGNCVATGCGAGEAFNQNGVCEACAAGKYQPNSAYDGACIDCPANSDTFGVTAATALSACKCDLGYTGADGGPCTACSTGQYKAVVGSAACLSCIANDPNSVSELDSASKFCECAAGYVLLSNVCTECIKGTYKEMQGNETDYITANCVLVDGCCACGHNKTTLSTATVTADPNGGGCICQTGYGFGNDACLACDLGTYKDAENVQECTNCDVGGTTGLIKSTSEEACISDLGYYTLDATVSATLGVDFAECPQDTYASETNLLECYDCPIGSTTQTLTTRTSVNDCICTETGYVAGGAHCTCAAGYYRAASGNCELCEENTYCIGAREAISGTCSANSVSDIGSTQLQDCKCNIGYSGPDGGPCTACEDHFYKANIGSEACTSCPVNSQSPTGSTSLSNCVCNAGFSGPDGGACSQCEAGTYKNLIGSSACVSCDAAETSPAASTSESACICIAGYYLVSDTCTACEIGTYQENLGATACETCPSGSSTANDASASIDLCLCMPGYYADFVGGNLAGCEQCADASYKTTLANTDCNSCPANAQSPPESDSITDCTCNAGYTGANGSPCTACEESTFKSTAGPQACDTCDANAYSPTGSTLQTACQCNAGYTGADGDVCVECEAGKYKTTIGASVCTPCPLNSYSNAASTLLQQCLCNAGYTGANGAQCSVCAVGTYKPLSGESECINCADNEISPQASTDISACECNVGHAYNVDTNSCEECIAGKFKDSIGDIDCSLCPLHSTSIAGATLITQCICNAGYEGVHGDTCVLCPAGKYENDAHVCVDCPDNSDSESGASTVFDCKCNAGFTGPHGGPCTACATGTYKINAGSAICTSCNLHATTLQDASTLATDCLCEAAYTLIDSSCTMCSENTFKTEISNAACTNCQEFAVSPPGSTQPSDCTCIDQYFDAGDGSCDRACGIGFEANLGETKCVGCQESYYKDFTGIDSCVACPDNAFSRKRNSTSIYSCLCHPGYFWEDNACVLCGAGKFSNLENVTACFDCVQAANADPATNIICPSLNQVPAGFQLNEAQNGIQICPNNTYNDGSQLTCTSCPSPSTFTNQAGLTSILQCKCNPGYFRNAENVCVACSLGTFKTQSGDDACTVCPANANTLLTASMSLSDCLCNPNYQLAPAGTLETPVCEACQAPAVKHTTSNVDSCVTCPEHATLLVGSEHAPLHCVCDPGYAFQNQQTCQACVNGKFKATFSDTTCLSCGANTETEPSTAATSKTQCLCKNTYEASLNGPPSISGGSCVRSCAPGKSGSAGVCSDCPRGRFKSSYGSACESCTFPRTASGKATTSKNKCTCPKRSFGIKATDLVTVSSIGSFIEDTAEIHVAIYDATSQTYSLTYVSKKYWKIQLGGVYQTVLLTVDNKKVFSCESNQFAVASLFCSNLNIDLQKIRGSLQLFAQRFNSEENILPNNVELYVFTEREVTFENVQPWVTTSVQNKAKSWAADGNLQIGGAVFKNKRVFNTENCAPCPRALVCREPA